MTNVKIMVAQAIEKLDAMSPEEFTKMLLKCGYPAEELLHTSIEINVELENDLAVANDYREGAKLRIAELEAVIQQVINLQVDTYGNATELHFNMISMAESLSKHLGDRDDGK